MSESIEIRHEEFDRAIGKLAQFGGINVLREEAAYFVRKAFQFTPPVKQNKPTDQAQGLHATTRDIRRAIKGVDLESWHSPAIRNALLKKDRAALQAIMRKQVSTEAIVYPTFEPRMHTAQRTRAGRVTKKHLRIYTMDSKGLKAYTKETRKHVGYMKSGWNHAANMVNAALGSVAVRIPAYVSKHRGPGASYEILTKDNPTVVLSNSVRGISQVAHAAHSAMKSRAVAIERKVSYLIRKQAQSGGLA